MYTDTTNPYHALENIYRDHHQALLKQLQPFQLAQQTNQTTYTNQAVNASSIGASTSTPQQADKDGLPDPETFSWLERLYYRWNLRKAQRAFIKKKRYEDLSKRQERWENIRISAVQDFYDKLPRR